MPQNDDKLVNTINGETAIIADKAITTDKWVNIEDAADYLSISVDTVRTWIRQGKLPAYKVGKRHKLKLSEIDQWVREGRITD